MIIKKNEDFEGLPVMGILRNLKRGRFFRGARKLLKKKKKRNIEVRCENRRQHKKRTRRRSQYESGVRTTEKERERRRRRRSVKEKLNNWMGKGNHVSVECCGVSVTVKKTVYRFVWVKLKPAWRVEPFRDFACTFCVTLYLRVGVNHKWSVVYFTISLLFWSFISTFTSVHGLHPLKAGELYLKLYSDYTF